MVRWQSLMKSARLCLAAANRTAPVSWSMLALVIEGLVMLAEQAQASNAKPLMLCPKLLTGQWSFSRSTHRDAIRRTSSSSTPMTAHRRPLYKRAVKLTRPIVSPDSEHEPADTINCRRADVFNLSPSSERNARGQDYVVVVVAMHRHRDLVTAAEGQTDAVVNRDSPNYESRR